MDFEHLSGPVLFGVAAVMIALAISYFAIRRSHSESAGSGAQRGTEHPTS
jgi:hypothetical protein